LFATSIIEGDYYQISGFYTFENRYTNSVVAHEAVIDLKSNTKVARLNPLTPQVPRHYFNFIDFTHLLTKGKGSRTLIGMNNNKKNSWCILITLLDLFFKLLTCFKFLIIRCTRSIKSYSATWASVGSRSRHNRQERVYHWKYQVWLILSAITTLIALLFTFYLLCRGDELRITLWGDIAKSFDDSVLHKHTNPIIVVFAGFRVTEFKGLYYQILPFKFSQFLSAPSIYLHLASFNLFSNNLNQFASFYS